MGRAFRPHETHLVRGCRRPRHDGRRGVQHGRYAHRHHDGCPPRMPSASITTRVWRKPWLPNGEGREPRFINYRHWLLGARHKPGESSEEYLLMRNRELDEAQAPGRDARPPAGPTKGTGSARCGRPLGGE